MKRVIYTSPFVPAELIGAHGLSAERLIPVSGRESKCCSVEGMCQYALTFVNEVTTKKGIGAAIFATTCDQMRRAADLIVRRSTTPVFLMNVPATWHTTTSRGLYRSELERLGRFLVGLGGSAPSSKQLAQVMMRVTLERSGSPGTIRPTVCSFGRAKRPSEPFGKPIALIGGPLPRDEHWLITAIEMAGGRIVLDGTENGERTLPALFDSRKIKTDPMAELVRAYFETIPDVFQRPNTRFYDWLERAILEREVQGVVVRHYVWCDLWRAEVPRIVERTNLPVLHIDTEGGSLSKERTISRIQSFFEILNNDKP